MPDTPSPSIPAPTAQPVVAPVETALHAFTRIEDAIKSGKFIDGSYLKDVRRFLESAASPSSVPTGEGVGELPASIRAMMLELVSAVHAFHLNAEIAKHMELSEAVVAARSDLESTILTALSSKDARIAELEEEVSDHCACTHDGRGTLTNECQEHADLRAALTESARETREKERAAAEAGWRARYAFDDESDRRGEETTRREWLDEKFPLPAALPVEAKEGG